MKKNTLKLAVVAIAVGGSAVLTQKFFGQKFDKAEWGFLCVSLVFFGWATFRFQQRREQRQLDLMRDSALW